MNFRSLLTKTASLLVVIALVIGCDDNGSDTTFSVSVEAPSGDPASVVVANSTGLTFSFSADAGYASSSVTAQNGSAEVSEEPDAGATSGEITVSFEGTSSGAGSVTLTVTDAEGNSDQSTAVVNVQEDPDTFVISENITGEVTWESGKTYILADRIAVVAGATLTIEGGALIKGEAGTGANSTALLVARDGTLNANGSADAPIIFTSIADEITPEMIANGNFVSPNLDPDIQGLWGGVLVLGNAPISASSVPASIEGIPQTDENGLYGGNDPGDSSGSISHISIRHGGTNIGEGNEINGLSMGGVGTGTTIENIEIVANQDDGLEWFGGTVSVQNVFVWNNGDDALDTDQDWTGTVSNAILVNPGGSAFELDGPEGSSSSGDAHLIENITAFMGQPGEIIDVDPNTNVDMRNIFVYGLQTSDGAVQNDISSDYAETFTDDEGNQQNGYAAQSTFTIEDIEAVIPDGFQASDFFDEGLAEDAPVTSVTLSERSLGHSDVSVFSWTWASQSGALGELGLE